MSARALDLLEEAVPESAGAIDSFTLVQLLAIARLRSGKTREALEAAERGLEMHPHEPSCVRVFVIAAVAEGRRNDAMRVLKAALAFAKANRSELVYGELPVLERKLKRARDSKRSLSEIVADLADPISLPDDEAYLRDTSTNLLTVARFRELARAIVPDPKKLAKNLRILKAHEPERTPEGTYASSSSIQDHGFRIEFNLSLAGISMLDPEVLRILVRSIEADAYGRVEFVRVESPFKATIWAEDGAKVPFGFCDWFGPTGIESMLTGDEPVYRTFTEEEYDSASDPDVMPELWDRRGWLKVIADWTVSGGYELLNRALDEIYLTGDADLIIEYARSALMTQTIPFLAAVNRKRAIKALSNLDIGSLNANARFRCLRLLGLALYEDGRTADAFETLFAALRLKIDSRILYAMGKAAVDTSTALLRESFDDRASAVWSVLERSTDILFKEFRLAQDFSGDRLEAFIPYVSPLQENWPVSVDLGEDDVASVHLTFGGEKAHALAQLAFLERMPEAVAKRWKFVVGLPTQENVEVRLGLALEVAGLTSLRLHPRREGDTIHITVALTGKTLRLTPRNRQIIRDLLFATIGEVAFTTYCNPVFELATKSVKGPGMGLKEFAEYFFGEFPNARGMTLTDTTFEWRTFTREEPDTRPEAPLFADITEGRELVPDLFDSAVFEDSDAPGAHFSRTMQSYGASTVVFAFDIVRTARTSRKKVKEGREKVFADFVRALEVDGAAKVVGEAQGESRAYVTAVLWQPQTALLAAARYLASEPTAAWAVYRTLLPGSDPAEIATNDMRRARKAFDDMSMALPSEPDELLRDFEAFYELLLKERRQDEIAIARREALLAEAIKACEKRDQGDAPADPVDPIALEVAGRLIYAHDFDYED